MSYQDDGGPAYPNDERQSESGICEPGMTLRDAFAMNVAGQCFRELVRRDARAMNKEQLIVLMHTVADDAYAIADAMLERRKR